MRTSFLTVATSLSVLSFASITNAADIIIDDGMHHVIDASNSFPIDSVSLFDSPVGDITSMSVEAGGFVEGITANENSMVSMLDGGSTSRLELLDNASLFMSGGDISSSLSASPFYLGNTTITGGTVRNARMSGGSFDISGINTGSLDFSGTAVGTVSNVREWFGFYPWLTTSGTADVDISQSQFDLVIMGGGSNLSLLDVDVASTFDLRGSSTVEFSGNIAGDITMAGSSTFKFLGGSFGTGLIADDQSLMIIHGSNFNYPLGDVPDFQGTLTGLTVDGVPFSVDFLRSHAGAQIRLVPNPGTLGVALATVLFGGRRRRMRRRG